MAITFAQFINFYVQNWQLIKPMLQMLGGALLIAYIFKARFYLLESFKSIWRDMYKMKKIAIIGKDGVIRTYNVNFNKEDFIMINDKKFYALSKKNFYHDWFGEKIYFYNVDGTEPISFKPYKKYIYVDKISREPLMDSKGNYATSLNWLQIASKKYEKQISDTAKKAEEFIDKGLMEEVTGITIREPNPIGNELEGAEPALTGDIINQYLRVQSIGFLKKYWQIIVMCVILILIMVIAGIYFSYRSNAGIDQLRVQLTSLGQNMTMMRGVPV